MDWMPVTWPGRAGKDYHMKNILWKYKIMAGTALKKLMEKGMKKEPGIDGILVTVGLCIIALLLCVVMKDRLEVFIKDIVDSLSAQAQKILTGVGA
jgi:hypothetical protein